MLTAEVLSGSIVTLEVRPVWTSGSFPTVATLCLILCCKTVETEPYGGCRYSADNVDTHGVVEVSVCESGGYHTD